MQETKRRNKLMLENKTLRKDLEETKRELVDKNDRIEVMGESMEIMDQFSQEMWNCIQLTIVYTVSLKE